MRRNGWRRREREGTKRVLVCVENSKAVNSAQPVSWPLKLFVIIVEVGVLRISHSAIRIMRARDKVFIRGKTRGSAVVRNS